MRKLKQWSGTFNGKIFLSVLLTLILTIGLGFTLVGSIYKFKDWDYQTTPYYIEESEGVDQAFDSALNLEADDKLGNNVEEVAKSDSIKNVNQNPDQITFLPVDSYYVTYLIDQKNNLVTRKYSTLFPFLKAFKNSNLDLFFARDSEFKIDPKLSFLQNIRNYFISYPFFQTYNIFFNVDQNEAYLLSKALYINNPKSIIWNNNNKIKKYQVKNQEEAELALAFLFYNWLLFYKDAFLNDGQIFLYNLLFKFDEEFNLMNFLNLSNYINNTGLNDYNQPIDLYIAGPSDSKAVLDTIIYNPKNGFQIFCWKNFQIEINYHFIEIDNDQILQTNDDHIYLKVQTRGMYDNELGESYGYSNYHLSDNNFYSPLVPSSQKDQLLYYTFYVRPLIFLINEDNDLFAEQAHHFKINWISDNGVYLLYTQEFSLQQILKYQEIGEFKI